MFLNNRENRDRRGPHDVRHCARRIPHEGSQDRPVRLREPQRGASILAAFLRGSAAPSLSRRIKPRTARDQSIPAPDLSSEDSVTQRFRRRSAEGLKDKEKTDPSQATPGQLLLWGGRDVPARLHREKQLHAAGLVLLRHLQFLRGAGPHRLRDVKHFDKVLPNIQNCQYLS